ncbi:MAG TPA: hypothetical protein VJZ71_10710 [Phycisphaerae bacterium]|nr:hypothetical protein [Phycisphaerae bacterium]
MNQNQYQQIAQWVNAHVDGLMDAGQRQTFEQMRSQSAVLRAELDRQALIDAALRRVFAPPPVEAILARVLGTPSKSAPASVVVVPRRRAKISPIIWGTAVAAAALLLAAGGWWAWLTWQDESSLTRAPIAAVLPKMRMEQVYQDLLATGFKPKWVCDDEKEFATTFYLRLGQGLAFVDAPKGIAMVGLSYANCLSPATVVFLAQVRDEEVIVLVDDASKDAGQTLAGDCGLNLFRRKIGKLMLFEVTPLDRPSVVDYFQEIDVPSEWIKNATYRP